MTSINKELLLLNEKQITRNELCPWLTEDESIVRGEEGGGAYKSEKRFVLKIKFCTAYEILLFVYS